MVYGKAVSRALRAHLLTESCLTCLLFEEISIQEQGIEGLKIKEFLNHLNADSPIEEINQFCASEVMTKVEQLLEDKINEIENRSRTSKLWLLYRHYIKVIKLYIIAERTSNWHLCIYITFLINLLTKFCICVSELNFPNIMVKRVSQLLYVT